MPTKLEQAQKKRTSTIRKRGPRVNAKTENKTRESYSGGSEARRKKLDEIERSANKKSAQRYQKEAKRAMEKDAKINKMAKAAATAASKRALSGAGRAAPLVGAVAAGAKAVKDVVEPRAEKAKAERKSYNQRASTSQAKAARGVRSATSGQRMKHLQEKSNKVKTKRR